jgi:hypothetical protein
VATTISESEEILFSAEAPEKKKDQQLAVRYISIRPSVSMFDSQQHGRTKDDCTESETTWRDKGFSPIVRSDPIARNDWELFGVSASFLVKEK